MTRDPVCGRRMGRRQAHIAIEFEGLTYFLCCPKFQAEFERDPIRYARKEYALKRANKEDRGAFPIRPQPRS